MTQEKINELYDKLLRSAGVCIDTRSLIKNSIFFSLKGENFNGNNYALDAIKNGASFSVVDDKKLRDKSDKFIYVEDVLVALQELAKVHRKRLDIPVVGITGSNGKTTTKNLIEVALKSKYNVYATKGNLNNHIGVPLSVLEINNAHEIAVIEMGASFVGEIGLLCEIAKPTLGIITNISNAHIKGFKNFEGVVRGKSELFDFLLKNEGNVFINNNDRVLKNFSKRFSDPIEVHGEKSIVKTKLIQSEPSIKFSIEKGIEYSVNLFGDYNYENIVMAISVAKFLGVREESSCQGISNFIPSDNRSEKLFINTNCIVMDAYNANPTSMKKAINSIVQFSNKKKIMVLGDMNELGDSSAQEHQKIGKIISKLNVESCYFIGKKMKDAHLLNKNSFWFDTRKELKEALLNIKIEDSDILIKGSRSLELEKLLPVIKKISA